MSYQPGKMGMAEGISLVFIATFPTIFLSVPAMRIEETGEIGFAAVFVTAGATLTVLLGLIRVARKIPGDLYHIAQQLLGLTAARMIALYYISLFLFIATSWIRQFAENTLTTALPYLNFQIAIAWYGLSAAFIIYLGIEAIARATYLILPFGISGLLLVILLLLPYYQPYYLFPWQGHGLSDAISSSLRMGADAGALLLLILAPAFQKPRTMTVAALFGLGGSSLLKSLAVAAFTMAFGVSVAQEKSLPFFEMARLVYLSRYIQRIEALFIILWVICGILGIAVTLYTALYLITRLAGLPAIRPLIPSVTILVMELAMLPADLANMLKLENTLMQSYYLIGLYFIPALLILASLWKKRRRNPCLAP